jgi:hypothetical protein
MKPGLREARRRWPKAIWIIGAGEYASVSRCPPDPTVMLFETRMEAEIAKAVIDDSACGGRCRRDHEIVFLGAGKGCPPIPRAEVIGEIKRRTAKSAQ